MNTTQPVNLRKRDNSARAIEQHVGYAIAVAEGYLGHWQNFSGRAVCDGPQPLAGLRVLELGPGATLGVPVLLACAGARVAVSDRFLAAWDDDFHPAFFRELLRQVDGRGPSFGDPIRELLRADGFVPTVIESYACGAEGLDHIDRSFDLVLSNAVLEHVLNVEATATNLARLTAPGGVGFHQVDFRDHRDFDRPLEFLTLPEDEFTQMRRDCFCECGCRWRVSEMTATFEEAGFTVRAHVNLQTTPEYLADVRPRLQPEFAALPDDDLLATSAFFHMSRGAANTAVR
jgi:SAM-dependent methyltransferase